MTSDPTDRDSDDDIPSSEELEEPSTEKEPGDEPKAPEPHTPEPSHEAVGIGIVETPEGTADSE